MKTRKALSRILLRVSFTLLLLNGLALAAVGKPQADDAAIKKYDTVAYFEAGQALKGDDSFTLLWHDKMWYFSTEENRDLFANNPEKYAPQYDGYCAWAMTEKRKAETDPAVWKIVNGKLYLNCSREAYGKWSRDIPGNIKKADKIWLEILGGK
jgi:hypothetical protein